MVLSAIYNALLPILAPYLSHYLYLAKYLTVST